MDPVSEHMIAKFRIFGRFSGFLRRVSVQDTWSTVLKRSPGILVVGILSRGTIQKNFACGSCSWWEAKDQKLSKSSDLNFWGGRNRWIAE
jgi:hypothetical protein